LEVRFGIFLIVFQEYTESYSEYEKLQSCSSPETGRDQPRRGFCVVWSLGADLNTIAADDNNKPHGWIYTSISKACFLIRRWRIQSTTDA
jgi:hypothetical protein